MNGRQNYEAIKRKARKCTTSIGRYATLRRAGTAAGTPFINCAIYNSRLVEPFAVKGFTSFECQPRSSSMNKWRNGQLRYSMRRYVYRPLLLRCRRWFFFGFSCHIAFSRQSVLPVAKAMYFIGTCIDLTVNETMRYFIVDCLQQRPVTTIKFI